MLAGRRHLIHAQRNPLLESETDFLARRTHVCTTAAAYQRSIGRVNHLSSCQLCRTQRHPPDRAVSRFLRASLGADFGYTPGEQPTDDGGWLKLNSNELPLPPSSTVAGCGGRGGDRPGTLSEPRGRTIAQRACASARRRAGAGVRRQRSRPGPGLLLSRLCVARRHRRANRARLLAAPGAGRSLFGEG